MLRAADVLTHGLSHARVKSTGTDRGLWPSWNEMVAILNQWGTFRVGAPENALNQSVVLQVVTGTKYGVTEKTPVQS